MLAPCLNGCLSRFKESPRFAEPLAGLTTFEIGGPAQVLARPSTSEELQDLLRACRECDTPWVILGAGSNVLISDAGVQGVVILLDHPSFSQISRVGEGVRAGAGVRLTALLKWMGQEGLGGGEFLTGIPGTVGGAVRMNAGTHAGQISDILIQADYLDRKGQPHTARSKDISFGYRMGLRQGVILEATLRLEPASSESIRARLSEMASYRAKTQDLAYPSAGSFFKNPSGHKAGGLIEAAGLKGVRVGGAKVSDKHANWIVNVGDAKSRHVRALMRLIRDRVKESEGILLEPEVELIGSEDG